MIEEREFRESQVKINQQILTGLEAVVNRLDDPERGDMALHKRVLKIENIWMKFIGAFVVVGVIYKGLDMFNPHPSAIDPKQLAVAIHDAMKDMRPPPPFERTP